MAKQYTIIFTRYDGAMSIVNVLGSKEDADEIIRQMLFADIDIEKAVLTEVVEVTQREIPPEV